MNGQVWEYAAALRDAADASTCPFARARLYGGRAVTSPSRIVDLTLSLLEFPQRQFDKDNRLMFQKFVLSIEYMFLTCCESVT